MVENKYYLNRRKLKTENKLHPWFIIGYSDGESSFSIRVRTNLRSRFGFYISIVYSIGAEIKPENKKLLELVKYYFNDQGSINKSGNLYLYEVSSIKELKIIRNHFEDFSLQNDYGIIKSFFLLKIRLWLFIEIKGKINVL